MSRTLILAIIAGVLFLLLILLFFSEKLMYYKRKKKIIEKLKEHGTLEKEGHYYYLIIGERQYQIFFKVMKNNEYLTINSHKMMQIDTNRDKRPLLIKYNYSGPPFKILILYPGLTRVKRAINENEVVFITHEDVLYDNFKVVREVEIDDFIKTIK